MPGSKKCGENCTCAKHARRLPDAERVSRHRKQAREASAAKRDECPACGGRKTVVSDLCQACRRAEQVITAQTPEQRRAKNLAYMKARREADPEWARQQARRQYASNGRKYNLKWKFSITPEQLAEIAVRQGDRCYLCERPLGSDRHVDHDHACCPGNRSCGKCVRGVAHQLCNQGIGQFDDDPSRMIQAARNLEAANQRVRHVRLGDPRH